MEFAKYIILLHDGKEQAVTFPQTVQHVDVFNYIRRQHPDIKVVSAGMFHDDPWWHGGESLTLGIKSRPEDAKLIQSMIKSTDRHLWDLRVMVWEACESSRHRAVAMTGPEMSLS
jgi:hypothetical protein